MSRLEHGGSNPSPAVGRCPLIDNDHLRQSRPDGGPAIRRLDRDHRRRAHDLAASAEECSKTKSEIGSSIERRGPEDPERHNRPVEARPKLLNRERMSVIFPVPTSVIMAALSVIVATELGAPEEIAGGIGLFVGTLVLTVWVATDWFPRGSGIQM